MAEITVKLEIETEVYFFVVFFIFLVAKLWDAIDWSWWWVTSPIWVLIGIYVIEVMAVWRVGK
jgi:hypothetical protein